MHVKIAKEHKRNVFIVLCQTVKKTLFLQIFGLVAFIEQKENDNNDNLCQGLLRALYYDVIVCCFQ